MQRNAARHVKDDKYDVDVTIDREWYQNWYTHGRDPMVGGGGSSRTIERCEPAHGQGHGEGGKPAGREGRRMEHQARNATGPVSRSQDQPCGVFRISETYSFWRERYRTIDDLVKRLQGMHEEYDADSLEGMTEPLQNV